MKKKYRRAVYYTTAALMAPFMVLSWFGWKLYESLWDVTWWLKYKLRVYDYDTD